MACYATLNHERSTSQIERNREDFVDFDAVDPEPVISAKESHAFLSVGNIKESGLDLLVESDMDYWNALRVLMLRGILYSLQTTVGGSAANEIYQISVAQVRIHNFREFFAKNGWDDFQLAVEYILQVWQAELQGKSIFPPGLHANLENLGKVLGLTPVEKEVLGVAILIQTEERLSVAQEIFGAGVSYHRVPRLLAAVLGRTAQEIHEALSPVGTLAHSHLLKVDPDGTGELFSRLDLIEQNFAVRMLTAQRHVLDALAGLIEPASEPSLEEQDFRHLQSRFSSVFDILYMGLRERRVGVNILLYGAPGTGKSQLAYVLAKKLHRKLISVSTQTLLGMPHSPIGRFNCYQLAQAMLDPDEAFIVFDECEEVLSQEGVFDPHPANSVRAQKSWINTLLERNKVPAIWIGNSVENFDSAIIRRFDACLKIDPPSGLYRQEMFHKICNETVPPNLVDQLVKNQGATPALVYQMADLVNFVGRGRTVQERGQTAIELINDKLKAMGQQMVKAPNTSSMRFRPDLVNSSVDLAFLVDGLKTHREGRLCLYGPPGTGKTAFGIWIAEQLEMPHQIMRASTLLGKYVGENEKNIAQAFESASQDGTVLQLDEADSFLSDRASSKTIWEVSMVNEMLTQIESFQGVFIASTNFYAYLDEAALRRFDMSIEFRFMRSEDAVKLFVETCHVFNLEEPTDLQKMTIFQAKNLTPGDFQQAMRKARFIRIEATQVLLDQLIELNAIKKFGNFKKIGF